MMKKTSSDVSITSSPVGKLERTNILLENQMQISNLFSVHNFSSFSPKFSFTILNSIGWNKKLERPLTGKSELRTLPVAAIPATFTAATFWAKCKTIGTIYNQARCGSCWAFAGVESAMGI
jgi:hypothetical protein